MKNLEMQGFEVLNEKELKAVEGGWGWRKWVGVSISAVAFGVAGFIGGGPAGAVLAGAAGAALAAQY